MVNLINTSICILLRIFYAIYFAVVIILSSIPITFIMFFIGSKPIMGKAWDVIINILTAPGIAFGTITEGFKEELMWSNL